MPSRYPTRRDRHLLPKPDRRRALEMLARCPQEGCSETLLLAHGFTIEQLVELGRAGLVQRPIGSSPAPASSKSPRCGSARKGRKALAAAKA
jgi:hypothetical protein